jgi:uncharacterized protein YndB with AHSA1/START domain
MDQKIAKATMTISSPPSKVWEALTKPELIKQYFFGAEIVTDWKEGSPIVYRGQWEGKPFEDKGVVLKVEPNRRLTVTHWSPFSGVPDVPENYHRVDYLLEAVGGGTRITITQDKNASDEEAAHSRKNWTAVLEGLKKLLKS